MSEPTRIDPERLAAMLEGKLSARERAELLAQVDASDEAFETLVDAAAVVEEMEQTGGAPVTRIDAPRRRWRSAPAGWIALAAGLAGVMLVPWAVARTRGGRADLANPARFAALLGESAQRLPAGWEEHPWTVTRGGRSPIADAEGALRFGALLTDVEVARRSTDSVVQQMLPSLTAELDAARDAAGSAPDPAYVDLGAWAEAARIAAFARNEAFFRSAQTMATLERLGSGAALGPTRRDIVRYLKSVIDRPGALDWPGLERAVTAVLRGSSN